MKFTKVVSLLLIAAVLFAADTPAWVSLGSDHRLHYRTDERSNRIVDFSHAGYKGGGVALPVVRW